MKYIYIVGLSLMFSSITVYSKSHITRTAKTLPTVKSSKCVQTKTKHFTIVTVYSDNTIKKLTRYGICIKVVKPKKTKKV